MNVSFLGYEESIATFEADSAVKTGNLVKISGNGRVSACASKDEFCGVAVDVRNGYASVQLKGYVEVPYTGSAVPSLGYSTLSAGSATQVTSVTSGGRSLLVVNKDETNTKVGIIL